MIELLLIILIIAFIFGGEFALQFIGALLTILCGLFLIVLSIGGLVILIAFAVMAG